MPWPPSERSEPIAHPLDAVTGSSGVGRVGRLVGCLVGRRAGRLRGGDHRCDCAARGQQGDRSGVGVHLDRLESSHPLGAAAPVVDAVTPDLSEVCVPAVGVGGQCTADLVVGLLPVALGELADADRPPRQVGAEVLVVLAGAEPSCSLAVHPDDLVGEVAGSVLSAGPALAEGHVLDRRAGDVGHAVLGPGDGRGVLAGLVAQGDRGRLLASQRHRRPRAVVGARRREGDHDHRGEPCGRTGPDATWTAH